MRQGSFSTRGLLAAAIAVCLGTSILAGEAAAQSVRVEGAVHDPTGAAVVGAEVSLQAASFSLSRTTDSDGSFVFESVPATSGNVSVRAQGFATLQRAWTAGTASAVRLEIVLSPATVNERIVVTATRVETRLSDIAGSAIALSSAELNATPALLVDDKLRQIPGFTLFRRSSSRAANPTAQGVSLSALGASGASRTLVLADGVPLNDPFGGWVYWGRIPQQGLAGVEVLRRGASSLYGSDALAGVIQFLPRPAENQALVVETSYGNRQTPNLSVWTGGRTGAWDVAAAADVFHTEGYVLVPEPERGAVDTAANSRHAIVEATLGRRLGAHTRIFGRGSFYAEARNNGTPVQTNDTRIGQGAAGLDTRLGASGSLALRLYGDAQRFNQGFSAVAADRMSELLTNRQHVPAQQAGGSAWWSLPVGHIQTLVAGLDFEEKMGSSHENIFASGTQATHSIAGGRQRMVGIYGEDILRLGAKWTVTASLRFDRWRNFDAESVRTPLAPPGPSTVTQLPDSTETAFSPRLSLLRTVSNNLSVTMSAYRAFRSPTLNELYRSFRVGNVVTQANSELHAERLTGAEAGVNAFAFHRNLNLRSTFFAADIVNPIANVTLSTTPSLITRQRQNLGRTRTRGVEIEAVARLSEAVELSSGYQFADATVARFPANTTLERLQIPQIPRHQWTVQARYWKPTRLLLSVQGRWVGAQFEDDQNTLPLDGYFTLDLLAGRSSRSGVEVYAAFENLFNQRYTVGLTPVPTLGPPLLARVGFRFHFPSRE